MNSAEKYIEFVSSFDKRYGDFLGNIVTEQVSPMLCNMTTEELLTLATDLFLLEIHLRQEWCPEWFAARHWYEETSSRRASLIQPQMTRPF